MDKPCGPQSLDEPFNSFCSGVFSPLRSYFPENISILLAFQAGPSMMRELLPAELWPLFDRCWSYAQEKSGITCLDLAKVYEKSKNDNIDQTPRRLIALDFRNRLQPVAMTNFGSAPDISTLLGLLRSKRLSSEEVASLEVLNFSDNNLMKDDLPILLKLIKEIFPKKSKLNIIFSNNRLYECFEELGLILDQPSVGYFDVTLNPIVSQAPFAKLLLNDTYNKKIICVQRIHDVSTAMEALHSNSVDAVMKDLKRTHEAFHKGEFHIFDNNCSNMAMIMRTAVSSPKKLTSTDTKTLPLWRPQTSDPLLSATLAVLGTVIVMYIFIRMGLIK